MTNNPMIYLKMRDGKYYVGKTKLGFNKRYSGADNALITIPCNPHLLSGMEQEAYEFCTAFGLPVDDRNRPSLKSLDNPYYSLLEVEYRQKLEQEEKASHQFTHKKLLRYYLNIKRMFEAETSRYEQEPVRNSLIDFDPSNRVKYREGKIYLLKKSAIERNEAMRVIEEALSLP